MCGGKGYLPRVYDLPNGAEIQVAGPTTAPTLTLRTAGIAWEPQQGDPNGNTKRLVLGALLEGLPLAGALSIVGLHDQTWDLWVDAEPDLETAMRQAREAPKRHWMGLVAQAARMDWKAAAWLLEKADPKTYGRGGQVEHKHTHEGTLALTAVSKMPLDGKDGLREAAAALLRLRDVVDGEVVDEEPLALPSDSSEAHSG